MLKPIASRDSCFVSSSRPDFRSLLLLCDADEFSGLREGVGVTDGTRLQLYCGDNGVDPSGLAKISLFPEQHRFIPTAQSDNCSRNLGGVIAFTRLSLAGSSFINWVWKRLVMRCCHSLKPDVPKIASEDIGHDGLLDPRLLLYWHHITF